ncbi:hypothetical protein [Pseudoalteromonas luteoviolacea]|uniref:hypothetical protein n=1 Tax=Pseudoalteromonas luteoviolacea TaxID=43657 RepID=UPI001B36FB20|nr:hypothetical protein [Pseudoalteromonas luteoviolacea]MBQ4840037.1 hypothetical protein [Pseudoalteromonas luteoviolacea]
MTKFEIAITTLFIGFAIGQTTDFIKYKWQISRQRKALKSEIKSIQSDFNEKTERIKQIASELTQFHIGFSVPGKISTHIFEKCYPEVAPYLSENERKSIITIYNHVHNFNDEIAKEDRTTLEQAQRSLVKMYSQVVFGYDTASHFLENGGDKLFLHEADKIERINDEIQKFAKSWLL